MGVVAPPSQLRKQRIGGVDGARTFGPSGARERVKPLEFCNRRGKLPDRAQAAQSERLRTRRRTRQRIEGLRIRPPRRACEFRIGEPKHLRLRLEKRRQVKAEGAKADAERLEGPALVTAE